MKDHQCRLNQLGSSGYILKFKGIKTYLLKRHITLNK